MSLYEITKQGIFLHLQTGGHNLMCHYIHLFTAEPNLGGLYTLNKTKNFNTNKTASQAIIAAKWNTKVN